MYSNPRGYYSNIFMSAITKLQYMITHTLIDLLYPTMSIISTVSLAMLLFISEVLSVTDQWNKNISDRFSMLILPLFIIFIYIVMSEVQTY